MATASKSAIPSAGEIARILQQANPNVLRMALYQSTRDSELAAMKVERIPFWGGAFKVGMLAPEHVDDVHGKALDFLMSGGCATPAPPLGTDEMRRMMTMLLGEEISDFNYKFGMGDLNGDPFPFGVEWNDEPPAGIKQAFRIAIIGAGLGGLTTAIQLDRLGIPYVVLERNSDVGGTWWANDYPECRVDTASHHYQYSFMKNYPWKHYFATRDELLEYSREVARQFDLMRNIRLNTALVASEWDEESASWALRLRGADGSEEELSVNAVISCVGLFNSPNLPDIPGIDSFQGQKFHTTENGTMVAISPASASRRSASVRQVRSSCPQSRAMRAISRSFSDRRNGCQRSRAIGTRLPKRCNGCSITFRIIGTGSRSSRHRPIWATPRVCRTSTRTGSARAAR